MEHDPTAIEPGELDETLPQTPPFEFEPQTDLGPDQNAGITERALDPIEEAEAENPDDQSEDDGNADDNDDADEGDDE